MGGCCPQTLVCDQMWVMRAGLWAAVGGTGLILGVPVCGQPTVDVLARQCMRVAPSHHQGAAQALSPAWHKQSPVPSELRP